MDHLVIPEILKNHFLKKKSKMAEPHKINSNQRKINKKTMKIVRRPSKAFAVEMGCVSRSVCNFGSHKYTNLTLADMRFSLDSAAERLIENYFKIKADGSNVIIMSNKDGLNTISNWKPCYNKSFIINLAIVIDASYFVIIINNCRRAAHEKTAIYGNIKRNLRSSLTTTNDLRLNSTHFESNKVQIGDNKRKNSQIDWIHVKSKTQSEEKPSSLLLQILHLNGHLNSNFWQEYVAYGIEASHFSNSGAGNRSNDLKIFVSRPDQTISLTNGEKPAEMRSSSFRTTSQFPENTANPQNKRLRNMQPSFQDHSKSRDPFAFSQSETEKNKGKMHSGKSKRPCPSIESNKIEEKRERDDKIIKEKLPWFNKDIRLNERNYSRDYNEPPTKIINDKFGSTATDQMNSVLSTFWAPTKNDFPLLNSQSPQSRKAVSIKKVIPAMNNEYFEIEIVPNLSESEIDVITYDSSSSSEEIGDPEPCSILKTNGFDSSKRMSKEVRFKTEKPKSKSKTEYLAPFTHYTNTVPQSENKANKSRIEKHPTSSNILPKSNIKSGRLKVLEENTLEINLVPPNEIAEKRSPQLKEEVNHNDKVVRLNAGSEPAIKVSKKFMDVPETLPENIPGTIFDHKRAIKKEHSKDEVEGETECSEVRANTTESDISLELIIETLEVSDNENKRGKNDENNKTFSSEKPEITHKRTRSKSPQPNLQELEVVQSKIGDCESESTAENHITYTFKEKSLNEVRETQKCDRTLKSAKFRSVGDNSFHTENLKSEQLSNRNEDYVNTIKNSKVRDENLQKKVFRRKISPFKSDGKSAKSFFKYLLVRDNSGIELDENRITGKLKRLHSNRSINNVSETEVPEVVKTSSEAQIAVISPDSEVFDDISSAARNEDRQKISALADKGDKDKFLQHSHESQNNKLLKLNDETSARSTKQSENIAVRNDDSGILPIARKSRSRFPSFIHLEPQTISKTYNSKKSRLNSEGSSQEFFTGRNTPKEKVVLPVTSVGDYKAILQRILNASDTIYDIYPYPVSGEKKITIENEEKYVGRTTTLQLDKVSNPAKQRRSKNIRNRTTIKKGEAIRSDLKKQKCDVQELESTDGLESLKTLTSTLKRSESKDKYRLPKEIELVATKPIVSFFARDKRDQTKQAAKANEQKVIDLKNKPIVNTWNSEEVTKCICKCVEILNEMVDKHEKRRNMERRTTSTENVTNEGCVLKENTKTSDDIVDKEETRKKTETKADLIKAISNEIEGITMSHNDLQKGSKEKKKIRIAEIPEVVRENEVIVGKKEGDKVPNKLEVIKTRETEPIDIGSVEHKLDKSKPQQKTSSTACQKPSIELVTKNVGTEQKSSDSDYHMTFASSDTLLSNQQIPDSTQTVWSQGSLEVVTFPKTHDSSDFGSNILTEIQPSNESRVIPNTIDRKSRTSSEYLLSRKQSYRSLLSQNSNAASKNSADSDRKLDILESENSVHFIKPTSESKVFSETVLIQPSPLPQSPQNDSRSGDSHRGAHSQTQTNRELEQGTAVEQRCSCHNCHRSSLKSEMVGNWEIPSYKKEANAQTLPVRQAHSFTCKCHKCVTLDATGSDQKKLLFKNKSDESGDRRSVDDSGRSMGNRDSRMTSFTSWQDLQDKPSNKIRRRRSSAYLLLEAKGPKLSCKCPKCGGNFDVTHESHREHDNVRSYTSMDSKIRRPAKLESESVLLVSSKEKSVDALKDLHEKKSLEVSPKTSSKENRNIKDIYTVSSSMLDAHKRWMSDEGQMNRSVQNIPKSKNKPNEEVSDNESKHFRAVSERPNDKVKDKSLEDPEEKSGTSKDDQSVVKEPKPSKVVETKDKKKKGLVFVEEPKSREPKDTESITTIERVFQRNLSKESSRRFNEDDHKRSKTSKSEEPSESQKGSSKSKPSERDRKHSGSKSAASEPTDIKKTDSKSGNKEKSVKPEQSERKSSRSKRRPEETDNHRRKRSKLKFKELADGNPKSSEPESEEHERKSRSSNNKSLSSKETHNSKLPEDHNDKKHKRKSGQKTPNEKEETKKEDENTHIFRYFDILKDLIRSKLRYRSSERKSNICNTQICNYKDHSEHSLESENEWKTCVKCDNNQAQEEKSENSKPCPCKAKIRSHRGHCTKHTCKTKNRPKSRRQNVNEEPAGNDEILTKEQNEQIEEEAPKSINGNGGENETTDFNLYACRYFSRDMIVQHAINKSQLCSYHRACHESIRKRNSWDVKSNSEISDFGNLTVSIDNLNKIRKQAKRDNQKSESIGAISEGTGQNITEHYPLQLQVVSDIEKSNLSLHSKTCNSSYYSLVSSQINNANFTNSIEADSSKLCLAPDNVSQRSIDNELVYIKNYEFIKSAQEILFEPAFQTQTFYEELASSEQLLPSEVQLTNYVAVLNIPATHKPEKRQSRTVAQVPSDKSQCSTFHDAIEEPLLNLDLQIPTKLPNHEQENQNNLPTITDIITSDMSEMEVRNTLQNFDQLKKVSFKETDSTETYYELMDDIQIPITETSKTNEERNTSFPPYPETSHQSCLRTSNNLKLKGTKVNLDEKPVHLKSNSSQLNNRHRLPTESSKPTVNSEFEKMYLQNRFMNAQDLEGTLFSSKQSLCSNLNAFQRNMSNSYEPNKFDIVSRYPEEGGTSRKCRRKRDQSTNCYIKPCIVKDSSKSKGVVNLRCFNDGNLKYNRNFIISKTSLSKYKQEQTALLPKRFRLEAKQFVSTTTSSSELNLKSAMHNNEMFSRKCRKIDEGQKYL